MELTFGIDAMLIFSLAHHSARKTGPLFADVDLRFRMVRQPWEAS
jgi:hypothetical protein